MKRNKIAFALAISLEIGDWRESTSPIGASALRPESQVEGKYCFLKPVCQNSLEIYHCLPVYSCS
jgi:hypothetical protein